MTLPKAGKKLLVADDSLTIQKVIRLALSSEGYEIQAVSDGNDAVQQIAVFRPHVVLIDVSLPGKSAFEVKEEMNRHQDASRVQFILMSSAFEKVDEERAERVTFHGRLTKPFDPAHLRQVLNDVLVGSTGYDDELQELTADDLLKPIQPLEMSSLPLPPPPAEPAYVSQARPPSPPPQNPFAGLSRPPVLSPPSMSSEPTLSSNKDSMDLTFDDSLLEDLEPSETELESTDQDIKNLTDSTIRLSGLDDFQWSIKDPTKKSGSEFSENSSSHSPDLQFDDNAYDLEEIEPATHFNIDTQLPRATPAAAAAATSSPSPLPPPPSHSANGGQPDVMPLTVGQMEAVLRSQLQSTLEEMAQKMLPGIAEKIIRAEIHRMLEEQP